MNATVSEFSVPNIVPQHTDSRAYAAVLVLAADLARRDGGKEITDTISARVVWYTRVVSASVLPSAMLYIKNSWLSLRRE
jgi:hypothetical protein